MLQDGASYHTALTTKEFIADHAKRLTVYQLPSYSPDYNPIEHLWKNMKKRTTHNTFFRTTAERDTALTATFESFRARPSLIAAQVARFV